VNLSLVIPAFNEERRIGQTLAKIRSACARDWHRIEIIVVDDGSADRTAEVVQRCAAEMGSIRLLCHDTHMGKGAAVRTGVLAAGGDLVLFSDADLSTPMSELPRLIAAVQEGYDVAIGSRGLPDSRILVPQPLHRRIVGRMFPVLVRCIITRTFRDTQCGFKLFTRTAARRLFEPLRTRGFAFDVEILYRAEKLGMRVKEVPVSWINSPHSSVRIVQDSLSMLGALFAIRARTR